jgi:response regulator RpfG family c-di-GMP phosphodiesterase
MPNTPISKGKVLVVDDEQIVLTAFRIELHEAGFDVRTARSGKEALAVLLQEPAEIVFTDLVMPEMNGTELCRQIKRLSPLTEIILFSGNPYEVSQQQEAFMAAGGRDEMLRKPLADNILVTVTENLIKEIRYKREGYGDDADAKETHTYR